MNLSAAQTLAMKLMHEHNLFQQGWHFKFDRSVRRFGVCNYSRKVISLSQHLTSLNDVEKVKDTILHEIAHAIAGHKAGHGYAWQQVCIRIGAKPERCYSNEDTVTPSLAYKAVCGGCGKVHERARTPRTGRRISCRCQTGDWNKRILLEYKRQY